MTKILFVGEGTVSDAIRCQLPGLHLNKLGHDADFTVVDYRDARLLPLSGYDIAIFSRPHQDSLMLGYKRQGVKIITDMDDDFHTIPESHPGYKQVGKGDPNYLMKLDNSIYISDMVITATSELRTRLLPLNNNIKVIPNGWSADNFNWMVRRTMYKDRFIIGWGGTITHREDFQMCVNPIKRVLKTYPQAMVCIAGDHEIYNLLKAVPEKQKLFIPMTYYDLYPAVMGWWDVMLAPLLDNEFNRAKSDIKLVDAGAKGIPFICSDMPVYTNWPGGGIAIPDEDKSWYESMALLIEDKDLYRTLAHNGREAAKLREMTKLAKVWNGAIEEVMK